MDQEMLAAMRRLFEQTQTKVSEFAKDTYDMSFSSFLEDFSELWERMTAPLAEETAEEEKKSRCAEIAGALAGCAEQRKASESGRMKRERLQLDLNLYMVSYVFPAILEYCRKQLRAQPELLTDAVTAAWADTFHDGHIEAADYASIRGGFKSKLCFVTTAVCQGLNKEPECEEIRLMKQYRDEYLSAQPDGECQIEEYYDIAPTIVKRIARTENPQGEYQYLWDHYISRCVELVREGEQEECRSVYGEMMRVLKEKYLITNTH